VALFKLYCFYSKEEQVDRLTYTKVVEAEYLAVEERSRAFKTWVAALACLFYLKKVYKKVYLKEFCFIKQGLYKLESKERDFNYSEVEIVPSSLVVESLMALESLLANLLFNSFFSLLPNLISLNTP